VGRDEKRAPLKTPAWEANPWEDLFFYSILCSVAILKACTIITSATKTSWRNNVIATNMFSSSSYRVLFQSFCPQNISLLPKVVAEAHCMHQKKDGFTHSCVLFLLFSFHNIITNYFSA